MNLSLDLAQWQGQPRRTRGNLHSSTRPLEQGYDTGAPHERMSSIGKTREWGHGGGDEVAAHS